MCTALPGPREPRGLASRLALLPEGAPVAAGGLTRCQPSAAGEHSAQIRGGRHVSRAGVVKTRMKRWETG